MKVKGEIGGDADACTALRQPPLTRESAIDDSGRARPARSIRNNAFVAFHEYPNHALHQTNDWMAEIYERWTAAHGVIIVTPVYWYQSPSALKLMIGVQGRLDRYIGYYEPYATSHEALDRREAVQEEARNVARVVAHAVGELRAGRLSAKQRKLPRPRPK